MVGNDVPDFKTDSKPKITWSVHHDPEGVGESSRHSGFCRGPLPEHYEPIESPIDNPLHPGQTAAQSGGETLQDPDDKYGTTKDGYTVVCTNLSPEQSLSLLDEE